MRKTMEPSATCFHDCAECVAVSYGYVKKVNSCAAQAMGILVLQSNGRLMLLEFAVIVLETQAMIVLWQSHTEL